MTQIVKVNAAEFGLDQNKAEEMVSGLRPILDERALLQQVYQEVIQKELNPATMEEAKKLRIRIRDNRTKGIEKWHKANKEFYLAGGRFVDAIKNREISENERMEATLKEIEDHFENLEKERIAKLVAERSPIIIQYGQNPGMFDLGNMPQEQFDLMVAGMKQAHEAKLEAERKAEEERIAREKAEEEERERIRLENERLRKEAEEREAALKAEREAAERKLAEERAAAEKARKEAEEAARKEREALEAKMAEERRIAEEKAAKERAEAEAKAAAERAERERVEAELRARKEAEAKAEAERLAAIEAEANKGDAAKVKDLIADLQSIGEKYTFKSKKNQQMYADVRGLLNKVIAHIQK